MSITLQEAKQLRPGNILHDSKGRRWKVNGAVKTWKTDANRIRVPLKHGLYAYDALTEAEFTDGVCDLLTLGEPS
jgi:hypothetical protein